MLQAYRNGEWTDGEVSLSVRDFGVFQGVTAVERLRTFGGVPFAIHEHKLRLQQSLRGLNIEATVFCNAMEEIVGQLLDRNARMLEVQEDVGITILVTPGLVGGTQPTCIAYLSPLDWKRIFNQRTVGERLVISNIQQPSSLSVPRHLKLRSRVHYYLAGQQNSERNASPILVDADGTLTETASANILIVKAGNLIGPLDRQILPGINLGVVKKITAKLGLSFESSSITPQMLFDADEILLTGTGAGVWLGIVGDAESKGRSETPFLNQVRSEYDELAGVDVLEQSQRRLSG